MRRSIDRGLALATGVAAADQVVKQVMVRFVMDPPRTIEVLPVFNLVLVHNRGVSFGLLSGTLGPLVLSGLAAAIVVALTIALWRTERPIEALGYGAIIGGAVGNVIDRVLRGAVVDYLDLHAAGWHWPSFNLADIAITAGVAALLWSSFREERTG